MAVMINLFFWLGTTIVLIIRLLKIGIVGPLTILTIHCVFFITGLISAVGVFKSNKIAIYFAVFVGLYFAIFFGDMRSRNSFLDQVAIISRITGIVYVYFVLKWIIFQYKQKS